MSPEVTSFNMEENPEDNMGSHHFDNIKIIDSDESINSDYQLEEIIEEPVVIVTPK